MFGFFEKKKEFCCAICGSKDPQEGFRGAKGDICKNCADALENRDITCDDAFLFTEEQRKNLCNPALDAVELAETFKIEKAPLVLQEGEYCYYYGDACGGRIQTVTTGYTGRNKGVSVQIMKGVSYHTGGSAGQAVREQLIESSPVGRFVLTNKRFVLLTALYGFDIPGDKVQTIDVRPDGLGIYVKNKMHIVLTSDVRKIAIIITILTNATKQQQEERKQKSLETTKKRQTRKKQAPVLGADEIMKYKKLMDEGIITESQFERKKNEILGFTE